MLMMKIVCFVVVVLCTLAVLRMLECLNLKGILTSLVFMTMATLIML